MVGLKCIGLYTVEAVKSNNCTKEFLHNSLNTLISYRSACFLSFTCFT